MNTKPGVSIVIAYSGEEAKRLLESVRSAQAQSYPGAEVIVVDDSAAAAAESILACAVQERLLVHRNPQPLGISAARNRGAKLASSELLLPLEPGDLLDSHYLEVTVAALNDGDFSGIYTDFRDFGDNADSSSVEKIELDIANLFCGDLCPTTILLRKDAFDSLGGYKTHLDGVATEDLVIRALLAGFKLSHVAEPLFTHPQHQNRQPPKLSDRLRLLVRENRDTAIDHLERILMNQTERFWDLVDDHDALYEQYKELHSIASGKYEKLRGLHDAALQEQNAQSKGLISAVRSIFAQRS